MEGGVLVVKGVIYLAIGALLLVSETIVARQKFDPSPKAEVYIITVELGEEVYTRYGHTVLQIVDPDNDRNHNFNWGIFDYQDPVAFGWLFFKGILTYKLGDQNYRWMFSHYRRNKRTMVRNKINLTAKQKTQLFDIISTNLRPENLTYSYQYFFNNCSTIIRDYLDKVLGGQICKSYCEQRTTKTFRDYVRGNLNYPPIIVFALDIFMNGDIDKPLTKWQEMFYPLKLKQYLAELMTVSDRGFFSHGSLLSVDEILYRGKIYSSSPINSFHVVALVFGMLLLLAWVLYWKFGSRLLAGLLFSVWGLASSLLSIVMLISWGYSEHLDLHHNANLWLFWPTDILLVWVGWKFMTRKRFRYWNEWSIYFVAHFIAWLLLVILRIIGIVNQNVDQILYYLSPLFLAVMVSAYRVTDRYYKQVSRQTV